METGAKAARILIIEDHADTLAMMNRLLLRLGYHTTLASDCAAARAALEASPLELVIADIGLPDGSALDVIGELRQKGLTPVIATSGYGMASDMAKAQAAGVDCCILKPVSIPHLLGAVKALLGGRTPAGPRFPIPAVWEDFPAADKVDVKARIPGA